MQINPQILAKENGVATTACFLSCSCVAYFLHRLHTLETSLILPFLPQHGIQPQSSSVSLMGGVIFVIPITLTIAFKAPKMEPAGPSQIRVLHDVPRLWNFDNILGFVGAWQGMEAFRIWKWFEKSKFFVEMTSTPFEHIPQPWCVHCVGPSAKFWMFIKGASLIMKEETPVEAVYWNVLYKHIIFIYMHNYKYYFPGK